MGIFSTRWVRISSIACSCVTPGLAVISSCLGVITSLTGLSSGSKSRSLLVTMPQTLLSLSTTTSPDTPCLAISLLASPTVASSGIV